MAKKRFALRVLDPIEEAARRDREQQSDVSKSNPDQYGRPFRRMLAERANQAKRGIKSAFRSFSDSSARQDLEYPSKPPKAEIPAKRLMEAVEPDTERARVYPEVDPNAVQLLPPVDGVAPIRKPTRDSRVPSRTKRASTNDPAKIALTSAAEPKPVPRNAAIRTPRVVTPEEKGTLMQSPPAYDRERFADPDGTFALQALPPMPPESRALVEDLAAVIDQRDRYSQSLREQASQNHILNYIAGRHHMKRDEAARIDASTDVLRTLLNNAISTGYRVNDDLATRQREMLSTRGSTAQQLAAAGAAPTPMMAAAGNTEAVQQALTAGDKAVAEVEAMPSTNVLGALADSQMAAANATRQQAEQQMLMRADPNQFAREMGLPSMFGPVFAMQQFGVPTFIEEGQTPNPMIGGTDKNGNFVPSPAMTARASQLRGQVQQNFEANRRYDPTQDNKLVEEMVMEATAALGADIDYDSTVQYLSQNVGTAIMQQLARQYMEERNMDQRQALQTAAQVVNALINRAAGEANLSTQQQIRAWGGGQ